MLTSYVPESLADEIQEYIDALNEQDEGARSVSWFLRFVSAQFLAGQEQTHRQSKKTPASQPA